MKYSKVIIAVMTALNAVFTAAFVLVFIKSGTEPIVLITAWYATSIGVLWRATDICKKKITGEG